MTDAQRVRRSKLQKLRSNLMYIHYDLTVNFPELQEILKFVTHCVELVDAEVALNDE